MRPPTADGADDRGLAMCATRPCADRALLIIVIRPASSCARRRSRDWTCAPSATQVVDEDSAAPISSPSLTCWSRRRAGRRRACVLPFALPTADRGRVRHKLAHRRVCRSVCTRQFAARGRGLGKSVVSACIAHLIESNLRPLYIVDQNNAESVPSLKSWVILIPARVSERALVHCRRQA